MNRKKGFTLVELLVVIAIIALLIGLLLPALAKARRNAQSLKDKTQISQIHKAGLGFAGENKGRLPLPGLINRAADPILGQTPGQGPEDVTVNKSAFLYSAMIAQNLFNVDLLIGTTEVNPRILAKQDYNFDAFKPANDTYWDTSFLADPSADSNASYSHMALCGQRKKSEWKDTQKSGVAAFGSRATGGGPGGFGGATSGQDYEKSPTLELHGPKQQWYGHVCFNDNHTETLQNFYAAHCTYNAVNSNTISKDSIYAAEFTDFQPNGQASGDSYLGMFITSDAVSCTPKWDPLNP